MNGFSGFKESPVKQKNFNKTGSKASTTPGYSTTKAAKKSKLPKNFNATGSSKAGKFVTKGIKPLLKGVLKRGTGLVGMFLGATQTATADQPTKGKGKTEYPGGKIDFTKKK